MTYARAALALSAVLSAGPMHTRTGHRCDMDVAAQRPRKAWRPLHPPFSLSSSREGSEKDGTSFLDGLRGHCVSVSSRTQSTFCCWLAKGSCFGMHTEPLLSGLICSGPWRSTHPAGGWNAPPAQPAVSLHKAQHASCVAAVKFPILLPPSRAEPALKVQSDDGGAGAGGGAGGAGGPMWVHWLSSVMEVSTLAYHTEKLCWMAAKTAGNLSDTSVYCNDAMAQRDGNAYCTRNASGEHTFRCGEHDGGGVT